MKNRLPFKPIIAIFLITLSGYLVTLNSTLFRNDSPETIAGCVTLGITHPPGYPLFNLLGRCFYFFKIGNPAFTYNFMAALLGSLGVCLLFINLWILLSYPSTKNSNQFPNLKTISAAVASLSLAFSNGYWGNAIAAKGGIYLFQIILELLFFLVLQTINLDEKSKFKNFYFLLFLFWVGFANQWPSQLLLVPAFGAIEVLYFQHKRTIRFSNALKTIFFHLSFALIPISLYLYLPLRSHLYPALNFDAPFTSPRFWGAILRSDYMEKEMMTNHSSTFIHELNIKSLYISQHLSNEFYPLACIFILFGIWGFIQINRKLTLFCLTFLLTTILVNLIYLQVNPIEFWHMDDHLLSSNWLLSLFMGIGIYKAFHAIYTRPLSFKKISQTGLMVIILFLAPLTFAQNFKTNNQRDKFLYYGYGMTALQSLPLNSFYFAESDYDYFSVLYLKTVLNKRPDTHLFLTAFLNRPYEREVLLKTDPTIHIPSQSHQPTLFDLVSCNSKSHPIYSTFSSVGFLDLYLKSFKTMKLEPSGILTRIIEPNEPFSPVTLYPILQSFSEEYLKPEIKNPSPTQGILREACASPYLNAAQYERLKGHLNYWDWYYSIAIPLISDPHWLAQTWFDKAGGDVVKGNLLEAKKSYQIAGYYFYQLGLLGKANETLEKATALPSI